MSEDLNLNPEIVLASIGFNDGANKGFWRIQPRDDEGQWIEMGGDVLFRFRTGKGNLVVATEKGVYVGPSGRPGMARVLIAQDTESGLKAGVYEVESRNLQQFKAILPSKDGKGTSAGTRKDKFGKPVNTLDDSKLPALEDLVGKVQKITEEDRRLAKGDLTPEERAAEQDGRENSPIADLPAGFEAENPDEVKDLLRKSGVDPEQFDKKTEPKTPAEQPKAKAPKAEEDLAETVVKDILADVAYSGDTTSKLDDLIKKQESLAALRESGNRLVQAINIERGDILVADNGEEASVVDLRSGNENSIMRIKVQRADGGIQEITVPMGDQLTVASGRRGQIRRPAEPTPSTTPEPSTPEDVTPSTPEAPSDETTEPGETDLADAVEVVPTNPGLQPANFPPADRMDDGSEFELPQLTSEEIDAARNTSLTPLLDPDGTPAKFLNEDNKVVDAEDPFEMMAALAKIYPNAKFTEDGALVLHRQKDKDGRIFELRANNSGKKAVIYSMRWTNPETGEFKEYQHKDDRHSIKALLRKDNGPQDLLDRLLGRTDNKGKNWGTLKFGNSSWSPSDSLAKRLRWFMSGTGDRKKMEELGDNAVRLANGRAAVYHKDGTIKNSEIPSLWDSFREYITSGDTAEDRDVEARENLYQNLYAVFGRAPLDAKAHAQYRIAIRNEFARKFPNRSVAETRSFNGIVTSASERMRGIYREPDAQVRSIRYASKDRTRAIETGMVTEYTNNVGETSIVKVSNLISNIAATPTNGSSYDYGDYVVIKDVNGREITVNALKLKILLDQKTPLSVYKKNLRGEALRQRRIDLGQWEPEAPPTARPVRDRPVGTYLGTSGIPGQDTVISEPPAPPKLIDDFVVGEMLYNKEGRPLGIIKATRPVTGRNGTAGIAFLYQKADGTEGQVTYALGTEITPKKA